MNNSEEKRGTTRVDVSCEIFCNLLGSEKLHKALCITLSGTGVSFVSEYPFEIGAVVEVSIVPETESTAAVHFFITIVRCRAIENGCFEFGARIQMPE